MKLYEATNGFIGYSYVRCNVWANDEKEALELAKKAYKESDEAKIHGNRYWENIELELIVDSEKDIEPFYTEPTD
ncbi:hypothetical protein [Bacillus sp. FJAT-29814]|uniref:hypothetical protein n=1 Tax=Bacillus sp. FJAT-29814 TaxID=1729688 RepID=UPI000831304F|nr:hypothetical protein [Bacillus sp. FJAT-29814]